MAGRRPSVNSKISTSPKQVQSRCFTLARRSFDGAEEDIVMKIVEYAQQQIRGMNMKEIMGMRTNLWGDVTLTIDVAELTDSRTEKSRYREACRHLVTKLIEVEKGNGDWLMVPFFQRVEKTGQVLQVQVAKEIWDCMLDFSKRCADIYSLEVALSLKSQYAKRIYMIISQSTLPMKYSLESLNKAFNTNYTAKMFEVRVLDQAKKELDRLADWSIKYEPYYPTDKQWAEMRAAGVKGRKPILGWTLTPIRIHTVDADQADIARRQRRGSYHRTPQPVRDWLINNMDFDSAGVNKNDDKIYAALESMKSNWEYEFDAIKAAMAPFRSTIKSRPGYFLQCLANRLAELKDPLAQVRNGVIDQFRFE